MASLISRSFKDISLSFKRHPVTNDVLVIKNEDAIKKSVINLCRTRLTERFFNDLLGTSIEDSIFELNNGEVASSVEEEVKVLLQNFEPRINVTDVIADTETDPNGLYISVRYNIVGLPVAAQNIEFLLQPTRV